MWNEGTYQYPPLYFLLLAVSAFLVRNEVLALKLTAVLVFCLRPLTTYLFAKRVFGGRASGLAAAWLTSIPPFAVEMLGWGGYPNLLGLVVLPLAFYSTLNLVEEASVENLAAALILALTVMFTHHLTFLVFVGVLSLWVLTLASMREKHKFMMAGFVLAFSLSAFAVYRLTLAWPNQFVLFNEAAYYRLTLAANPGSVMWVFKDRLLLFLVFLAAFLSMVLSVEEKMEKRGSLALLAAWVLAPLLMSQGNLLGVTMDYVRIFLFTAQPLLIFAAMPFTFLGKVFEGCSGFLYTLRDDLTAFLKSVKERRLRGRVKPSGKRLLVLALVSVTLIAAAMNLAWGVETFRRVEAYYNGVDYYGDREKLEAAEWVLENTSPGEVFVAEEQIGRWIEGLGRRKVLLYQDPEFLFMEGEVERAYAARGIFTSNYGILNGFVWVFDQAPYGRFSPIVSFYLKGDYRELMYVDPAYIQVRWVCGGESKSATLMNSSIEVEWVERSSDRATLLVRYVMDEFIVERSVEVEKGASYTRFSFRVIPLAENVKPLSLKVCLNMSEGVAFWEARMLPGKTVGLLTNVGWVNVQSSADSILLPPVKREGRRWLTLVFDGEVGEFKVQVYDPKGRAGVVRSYTGKELTACYGVRYVVLPRRLYLNPEGGAIDLKEKAKYETYDHLLRNGNFSIAYENERLIILKVTG